MVGVLTCLLLAAVIVDPLREVVALDDGWAYARTVEVMLRTGVYRLDEWSAASMPVQILQAAGLSTVFGYSLGLLRLTTVAMLAIALVSFYGLTREFGASRVTGFAATLCFLASPLVLQLSFTFMSDIHFIGWLLAALLLYCRGFRCSANGSIIAGSIAAACAVGTRQFGVAVVVALFLAWIVCRPAVRPRLTILLLAVALPACAGAWQIVNSAALPTFAQRVRLDQQELFLGKPMDVLVHEFVWRAVVLFQYVGIGIVPALPLVIAAAVSYARASPRRAARLALLVALITTGICAVLWTGSPVFGGASMRGLWPALGMPWLLRNYLPQELYRLVDFAGILAAAALSAVVAVALPRARSVRRHGLGPMLLVTTALCLFGLHLLYVQMNDTYVVPFITFALLLLAVLSPTPTRFAVASATVSLAAIALISLWIRAIYAEQAALWVANDRLSAAGVPIDQIRETFCNWPFYHGTFDDWLAVGAPGYDLSLDTADNNTFVASFLQWVASRAESATYRVEVAPVAAPGWRLISRDSYLDFTFQAKEVLTYERAGAENAPN